MMLEGVIRLSTDDEKGDQVDFRFEARMQRMRIRRGPPIMRRHSHMYPPIYRGVQRRISEKYRREYERLRGSIYEYLRHRPDFEGAVDSSLVELTARLFADWLYVEELLTKEAKSDVWKYADSLAKIHNMLLRVLEELKVTPKMRVKLAQDLVESDEITEKLKKLFEGR